MRVHEPERLAAVTKRVAGIIGGRGSRWKGGMRLPVGVGLVDERSRQSTPLQFRAGYDVVSVTCRSPTVRA